MKKLDERVFAQHSCLSSPEHEGLKVSSCYHSMSGTRHMLSVMWRHQFVLRPTPPISQGQF